jgi:hypothetical protein
MEVLKSSNPHADTFIAFVVIYVTGGALMESVTS